MALLLKYKYWLAAFLILLLAVVFWPMRKVNVDKVATIEKQVTTLENQATRQESATAQVKLKTVQDEAVVEQADKKAAAEEAALPPERNYKDGSVDNNQATHDLITQLYEANKDKTTEITDLKTVVADLKAEVASEEKTLAIQDEEIALQKQEAAAVQAQIADEAHNRHILYFKIAGVAVLCLIGAHVVLGIAHVMAL